MKEYIEKAKTWCNNNKLVCTILLVGVAVLATILITKKPFSKKRVYAK